MCKKEVAQERNVGSTSSGASHSRVLDRSNPTHSRSMTLMLGECVQVHVYVFGFSPQCSIFIFLLLAFLLFTQRYRHKKRLSATIFLLSVLLMNEEITTIMLKYADKPLFITTQGVRCDPSRVDRG